MDGMVKLAENFYRDEYSDSVLYARLAKGEGGDGEIKKELLRLSKIEAKHARFWYEFVKKRGGGRPPRNPLWGEAQGF